MLSVSFDVRSFQTQKADICRTVSVAWVLKRFSISWITVSSVVKYSLILDLILATNVSAVIVSSRCNRRIKQSIAVETSKLFHVSFCNCCGMSISRDVQASFASCNSCSNLSYVLHCWRVAFRLATLSNAFNNVSVTSLQVAYSETAIAAENQSKKLYSKPMSNSSATCTTAILRWPLWN